MWFIVITVHVSGYRYFLVSQGSVATLVRCGGIYNANFIANFLKSQPVKELWKSADIWQSYRKSKKGAFFWNTVYCHMSQDILFCFSISLSSSLSLCPPFCMCVLCVCLWTSVAWKNEWMNEWINMFINATNRHFTIESINADICLLVSPTTWEVAVHFFRSHRSRMMFCTHDFLIRGAILDTVIGLLRYWLNSPFLSFHISVVIYIHCCPILLKYILKPLLTTMPSDSSLFSTTSLHTMLFLFLS